ncbi:centromere protein H isoform X1 [Rattus norvegicus]|uniref:Centromere protein H n=1 Tax=Rattus norvegicus TaxID=10116 RepID=A0ABK0KZN8_RAT
MEPLRERPVAGAEACGEERGPQASEERIMDRISLLLRLRAQTKQQLLEYKSVIDANEEKTPEQIMQEKQIEVKIEDLENEIEDVKSNFEVKSLALSSLLTDDMKHVMQLQKLIMKSQEESKELEKKLLDVRKKRLQLKQASRSKLLEIQTERNKQKEDVDKMENSEVVKAMKDKLQLEIKITTVIQHAFQGLILGSKTNWAEDPTLRELVLQLEKNLTTL